MKDILFAMGPSGSQGGSPFAMLLPIVGMLVIFYLLLIRPQQKRQKQQQQMIDALRKGDRVITTSGIYGTIAGIKDNIIVLTIAENVKVEIMKNSVASLVQKSD
ncbi:MAG: preprotein translocase subunit YajC [Chitinivibrionia bacterium]|nr:preprotein translocase subunit YajC [Chitinivibrionia bacterium]